MFKKYPLLYKRLDDIGRMELSNGKIPKCVKIFFLQLIDFCITYFKNLPLRQESDYRSIKKRRMSSQNASLFGVSRGSEQDIKLIIKVVRRIQILGMSSVQNSFQNTAGSHQVSSLLPVAALVLVLISS